MKQFNAYIFNRHLGVSLIELLVAVAIGSFMMLGLTTTFRNSSESQRALTKASQLIENGRYAISILDEDLRHAGYYGHFYELADPPTNAPDPCEISSLTRLTQGMSVPVQSYTAANFSTRAAITSTPTTCHASLLTDANLSPGSDILVIRRANTGVFTGTPNTNEVYIQSNARSANLMYGDSNANVPTDTADNNTTTNLKMFPNQPGNTTSADTRSYDVHVYFIAPCSFGSGANDICTANDDDIPTLKRLELSSDGTNTKMNIEPLVEGIQLMKLEYGLDTSPTTVNPVTDSQGDGVPDSYVSSPTQAQWPAVVSIGVHLLARSPQETRSYTDTKVYTLAGSTVTASLTSDSFKRHVFSTEVRPMNMSGRREIPE